MTLEKHLKSKKGVFIVACFIIYSALCLVREGDVAFSYLWYRRTSEREPLYVYKGTEDFLINTPGCYIPNYGKKLSFSKIKNSYQTCGKRAVSVIHTSENNTITFKIESSVMKHYSKKAKMPNDCCYSFVSRSTTPRKEDTNINYTNCTPFKDGTSISLSGEVVTVTCYGTDKNKKSIIYKDAYIFINKIETTKTSGNNWNILLVGMDTMSRARVRSTMPRTRQYLDTHGWLDYKGYHKIGANTFPNLMGVLTGKKLGEITKNCSRGLDHCNELIIWSEFRKAGYVTAYGEDFLSLPDTFSRYDGFKTKPTHHYMRPLFLTGEQHVGNIVCAGKKPSAHHILSYASDFVESYKEDKFFGLFWINSYSHNLWNNPTKFDNDIVDFFKRLEKTGIMNNTFIIFFSDHGIRFGDMRLPMESYYEERLPMFFIWTPYQFRKSHSDKYYNLQLNQNRLVTPYDFHATFGEIMNTVKDYNDNETETGPKCSSLFEEKSAYRTCADASIDDKWCSCHGMAGTDTLDRGANASLQFAVSYIKSRAEATKTSACWKCAALQFKRVLRIHRYKDDNNRTNYVAAFEMVPGNVSFEVTVEENGKELNILGPTDTISAYNSRGNCVTVASTRPFCICQKINGCKR